MKTSKGDLTAQLPSSERAEKKKQRRITKPLGVMGKDL